MTEFTTPSQKNKSRLHIISVMAVVVFLVLALGGILTRLSEANSLKKTTAEDAIATVAVITAQEGAPTEEIVLPGTVEAWHEATVYARTTGYIKNWTSDIGARVKAGDVLAEIDAPDLDAQLHQAEADLATAEANNQLAQITAKRWLELLKTDSVAKQDADTKVATAAADEAMVNSAKANLDHLQQEEDFKKVVAPFDGVVTQRNTDIGALVNGGSSTGQDLFHVAQTDKLRVYVSVPENYISAITPDLTAELHFPQNGEQTFTAKLSRTADALDPTTRSLLIELEVDNPDNMLLSGSYTDAHLKIPTAKSTLLVPVNALLFREKLQAAIVKDNHVHLVALTPGRDYGKTMEITSGLTAGDQVVINPPDSLSDGQEVRIAPPSP